MFLDLAKLPSSPALLRDPAVGEKLGEGPRTNASCGSDFNWARSSVGTSPCLIAAEVLGACNGGNWNLPSLLDDIHYPSPSVMTANSCFCSWSAYNLLSACSACQGHEDRIYDWAVYQLSCSPLGLSDAYFPDNISSPVLIPHWATQDPTVWYNHRFNVTGARLLANQSINDSVPRVANWQSSMVPSSGVSASGFVADVIGVIGVLGGLAGIVFAFDIVLYMIYRATRRRPEIYNHYIGREALHAIALIPPPSRRRAHTIPTPATPVPQENNSVPGRTQRLAFTPIFI